MVMHVIEYCSSEQFNFEILYNNNIIIAGLIYMNPISSLSPLSSLEEKELCISFKYVHNFIV